jgi:hypothetical protein
MQLSPRQRRTLDSICDTFAPATEGWPSATELEIPETLARMLDFNPRSSEKSVLLQLLDLWDSRVHSLLTVGRFKRFSSLPQEVELAYCFLGRTVIS